jgi:hypothetical protein
MRWDHRLPSSDRRESDLHLPWARGEGISRVETGADIEPRWSHHRPPRTDHVPCSRDAIAVSLLAAPGIVKVVADARYGEIIDAHVVGSRACDMIAVMTLARARIVQPHRW